MSRARSGSRIFLASLVFAGAALGQPAAALEYQKAYEALEEHRPDVALPLLRRAATSGHLEAQRTLGFILLYGDGLYGPFMPRGDAATRRAESIEWLRRAAAQGDLSSRHVLNSIGRDAAAR